MSSREFLTKAAARAKRAGFVDLPLRYNPFARHKVVRSIHKFAEADEARRRHLATECCSGIVKLARKAPYGRTFGDSIEQWPVLSKEVVRDRVDDFRVPGTVRIPAATGGTTGIPIRLVRSAASVAAEQAFLDHLLLEQRIDLSSARVAILRGDNIKPPNDWTPPFAIKTHWGRRLIFSPSHLSSATIDWYVEALAQFRPDVLWAYPTMVLDLLHFVGERSPTLRIPVVLTSSEVLEAAQYRYIEERLCQSLIDYYGQAERVCLAVSEGPERYRFQPAYGRAELIPSRDDEIDGDRRYVRVIATGYWNDAMPLVRYDTEDFAIVPRDATEAELDAIALGSRPFFGIAGRASEFIYRPDGGRIAGLNQIPREVSHLLQIQIVQEALDVLVVRAQVMPDFDATDAAKLTSNVRAKVPSSIRVEIRVVDRLERNGAGKTPFVIRRMRVPSAFPTA